MFENYRMATCSATNKMNLTLIIPNLKFSKFINCLLQAISLQPVWDNKEKFIKKAKYELIITVNQDNFAPSLRHGTIYMHYFQ